MSRNITTLTGLSAVEYVESGTSQLGAQKPTIPSSDDGLSTNVPNEQKTKEDIASPALEHTHNNRKDNTHNDEDLNEIVCKIGDIILDGSDDLGGKKSIKDQDPDVKQLDQNNRPQGSVRCISHTTVSVPIGDSPSPLVGVSKCCASSPPIDERPQLIPIMVDEPDPRLIDALRKPLDRPLILKVEQEVIAFITGTLDCYDTAPLNSYHRMLVHKIAEFYRLTHIVSPDTIDCVRLFRGHAARIPPMKLSDMASQKSPPATPPSGTPLAAVKIMRRKSPSQKGVDDGSDQTGDGRGSGGTQASDLLKLMTREEKEAAYQIARARIFRDFKESPPESPSPSKSSNEKQMLQRNNQEQADGFQGRSQYPYRVVTQTFPNFGNPKNRLSLNPCAVPGLSTLNPSAVSFSPSSRAFIPAPLAGQAQPALSQQYPLISTHGGGYSVYPQVQPSNMTSSVTQPNLNRPALHPSANRFTSLITPLPYGPQSSHGNAALGNSRLPSTNPGSTPTTTDCSWGPHQLGRIIDQPTGSNITYPPSLSYLGHQNSNTNGNGRMNSNMNGGWPPVSANSIQQQGRFPQGEGPLSNGNSENFGPYGVGRG
ncbi:hypothetical protein BGX38DRAFT_1151923 [Terfezia claveryi]|nr:hypothetical protein BGX38DRAFT_1151923 [Terfezia claveryi]